ncbi:MAG: phosphatase PAP2 family protein [Candidatus Aenigmatarchaeota archaeon]
MELKRKILIGVTIYAVSLLFLDQIMAFDQQLFLAVNSISNPLLDPFFVFITYLGSSVFWIVAVMLLWMRGKRKASIYLVLAFIIDTVSLFFLKFLISRPRPFENLSDLNFLSLEMDLGPSFPSGHTQRAFSGAVVLGSFYKKFSKLFFALALLVGISRIYIGVHYPFDILSGSINGFLIGSIVLILPIKKIAKKIKLI